MNHKKILITATFIGLFSGFTLLSVGLIHNPQCEFYCEGSIDWRYMFFFLGTTTIFLGGFFYFFLISCRFLYQYDIDD